MRVFYPHKSRPRTTALDKNKTVSSRVDDSLSHGDARSLFLEINPGPTKAITKPIRDILSRNGKGIRTQLSSLVLQDFGEEEAEWRHFMLITELSRNGTLIIDDVEDDSIMRRGKPCCAERCRGQG